MKKQILQLGLAVIIATATVSSVLAVTDSELRTAIKLYKAGNYSQCIQMLDPLLKRDPSNAAAHYYLAISYAQAGRVNDAINHYEKVISLNTQETLVRYAKKGKLCLESPDRCDMSNSLDEFIRASEGFDITNFVQRNIESQDLDELRRDINQNKEIDSERLKKFKNFSSSSDLSSPTDAEIVSAIRTLQKAGLNMPMTNTGLSDMSMLFASSSNVDNTSSMDNLMQLMSRMGNSSGSRSNIDPRVFQTMMTSQMLGL